MLAKLQGAHKVVGLKQSKKAVKDGSAVHAFVAADAESRIVKPFCDLCRENNVEITTVESMRILGEAAGVEVPTATAVLLKD